MNSPNAATGKDSYAVLTTSLGTIVVELLPQAAPRTVANFIGLAKAGFYTGLVWHRIVKGFVIQTGDPNTKDAGGNRMTWGQGGGPDTVPLETSPDAHNATGYLGLARSNDPNSGSSQFYINVGDNSMSLDGGYAVFGRVVSGMTVVNAIASLPVYPGGFYADQPTDLSQAMLTGVKIQDTP